MIENIVPKVRVVEVYTAFHLYLQIGIGMFTTFYFVGCARKMRKK